MFPSMSGVQAVVFSGLFAILFGVPLVVATVAVFDWLVRGGGATNDEPTTPAAH